MNDKWDTSSKVLSRRIVTTEDGSTLIEIPEMNEMYHSRKGAIKESQFVYIDHGYNLCTSSPINVLEIGMGTGLNVLLTLIESKRQQRTTYFHTLEPYPLNTNEWAQLNFEKHLSIAKETLQLIHETKSDEELEINEYFKFQLSKTKLELCQLNNNQYDVVYFDAFAPNKQANPWQLDNIQKVYDCLRPGGILTTYCAQGQFKRNLLQVGFSVTNPEGPMGKREITVAYKK